MKTLFTILLFAFATQLSAIDEEFFLRQQEVAHPTPVYNTDVEDAIEAEKPASAIITDIKVMDEGFMDIYTRLFVQIPSTMIDKTTPLTNVKRLDIYGDGKFLRIFPLLQEEIGKEVQVNITEGLGNYSNISCVLVAGSGSQGNEIYSDTSNSVLVYQGKMLMDPDSINFEGSNDLYYTKDWSVTKETAQSKPNCIATSANGQYESGSEYSLYLRPTALLTVTSLGNVRNELKFDQICLVDSGDSAIVEISDNLKDWELLAKYSDKEYPQWQDDELKEEDWIREELTLIGDFNWDARPRFVRFRLITNNETNKKGWYVDNINLEPLVYGDVENSVIAGISIYPNPVSNMIHIKNEDHLPLDIEIVDLNGNILFKADKYYDSSIDVSNLSNGIYLVKLNYRDHSKVEKLTIIK